MPHLHQTETGDAARKLAVQRAPFGPGVPEAQAASIEKFVVEPQTRNR